MNEILLLRTISVRTAAYQVQKLADRSLMGEAEKQRESTEMRSSRFSIGGPLTVPSFPLDVGHLEQGNIIFQGNAFEIIQRQIGFHRLAKTLCGPIKIVYDRGFHLCHSGS